MRLLLGGLSPGTSAGYAGCLRRYLTFCASHGASFPPSATMIIAFASHLVCSGSTRATISSHISALRSSCIDAGMSLVAFSDPRIPRLLSGIGREGPPPRPPRPTRLPISGLLLARLLDSTPSSTPFGRSLRAGLALGFFGLLRAGEFCFKGAPYGVLLRRHLSWFPSHVSVLLIHSKTDRNHRGVSVRMFRSFTRICPVDLLAEVWTAAPIQSDDAPLLQDDRGLPLSYRALLYFIKQQVRAFGMDPDSFGAHSLRIGGASQLAASRFSEAQIQALGRWTSDCYQRYLRLPEECLQQAAASLGSSCSSTYGP